MENNRNSSDNFLMRISHEMAGGLQQLTGLAYDCFELILGNTEKEFDSLLDKKRKREINIGRYEMMYRMTHQTISLNDFRHLDGHNLDRIIKAVCEVQNHSFVTKGTANAKNNFVRTCIISTVKYNQLKKEFTIKFDDAIFYHYLNSRSTFRYDKSITDSFKNKYSKSLYILACSWDTLAEDSFRMTESMLRKFFSYEIIDENQFDYFDIYEEVVLDIVEKKDTTWQMISITLEKSLNEIKESFIKGKSPFWLDKMIFREFVRTGRRGKPNYKRTVEFYIKRDIIEDADIEELPMQSEVHVQDSNREEVIPPKSQPTVLEIPFKTELSDAQCQKIEAIKQEVKTIRTAEGATPSDVETYIKSLGIALNKCVAQRPEILECIGAWIRFSMEWAGKYDKTPADLSYLLQNKLKTHCKYNPGVPCFSLDESLTWPPHYKTKWLDSVDEEMEFLRAQRDFLQKIKDDNNITEETLDSYIIIFFESLYDAKGHPDLHVSADALKGHFECWVKIHHELENNRNNNNNNYGNKRFNQSQSNDDPHAAAKAAIRRRHQCPPPKEPTGFFE